MKKYINIIIIIQLLLNIMTINGQNNYTNIEYNASTGNYLIRYIQNDGQVLNTIFEPATKIIPSIQSNVSINNINNNYQYLFAVSNSVQSQQRIVTVSIEFLSPIFNVISPNKNWHSGFYSFASIVDWYNSKDEAGLRNPFDGIAIDSTENGFSFSSKGLPSIVNCYFMGGIKETLNLSEDAPLEVEAFLDEHEKFPANTVHRKVLGPNNIPDPLIPSVFADTIRSYISRSFTLDWIDSKSVTDKYLNLISSVINEISQENISNAKLILEQVLAEVETDSGNGLTSEAYALIKYNSKYLYDQLQDSEVSIEDLIAYINKAQSEGTIDNAGVANSLISKLETAQKQLEKEKPKQAVNALNAFLNELEAQHEKHIAEEVYTYLKEKVEGLIAQLEE